MAKLIAIAMKMRKETRLERENLKLKKESKYWKNRFDQFLEDRNDLEKDMEDMKRNFEEELSEAREDGDRTKVRMNRKVYLSWCDFDFATYTIVRAFRF